MPLPMVIPIAAGPAGMVAAGVEPLDLWVASDCAPGSRRADYRQDSDDFPATFATARLHPRRHFDRLHDSGSGAQAAVRRGDMDWQLTAKTAQLQSRRLGHIPRRRSLP